MGKKNQNKLYEKILVVLTIKTFIMNKPRLLSNLPIEDLTVENDYLGIIDKGDLIKEFLKGNKDQFHEIKMFSIYGEWGSGKSSLMKYLKKELDGEFNTFFFEAWEYEKDENLAMSLLEYITSKNTDVTKELYDNIVKYGGRVLRGLGKSVKMNIPLFTNGPAFEIDPSAFVEEVSKSEELTFQKALDSFKTEFVRFEDAITAGDKPKFNIVFIDDLDRCEPEQVLNLLSAIKLFFTYGQKTIFFCGIDKKAVEQAVKTKYGKVVKANEYMEKIFDISFTMPEHEDVLKLISLYFDDRPIKHGNFEGQLDYKISEFFISIKFTNPRRLKKVLNKYLILSYYKSIFRENNKHSYLIPNIITDDNGNFFETIIALYILCISEFYKETYEVFNDLNLKSQLIKVAIEKKQNYNRNAIPTDETDKVISILKGDYFNLFGFKGIFEKTKKTHTHDNLTYMLRVNFLIHFIDANDTEFFYGSLLNKNSFLKDYNSLDNKIDYLFIKYMFDNIESLVLNTTTLSNFKLSNFKKMIDKLL